MALRTGEGRRVTLLIDNRAAMYALRRRYSSNIEACDIIRRVDMLITENGLTVNFEPVDSKANPADRPSRYEKPDSNIILNAYCEAKRCKNKFGGRCMEDTVPECSIELRDPTLFIEGETVNIDTTVRSWNKAQKGTVKDGFYGKRGREE